jgi:hypothetical protein
VADNLEGVRLSCFTVIANTAGLSSTMSESASDSASLQRSITSCMANEVKITAEVRQATAVERETGRLVEGV